MVLSQDRQIHQYSRRESLSTEPCICGTYEKVGQQIVEKLREYLQSRALRNGYA